jgi:GNAT superfamily N-acetyltransferase
MLSVSPDVQAGGIGKALLRASEEWTIEQNLYSIVMNVITVRSELITWYNKQGYNDSGIRKPFPDDKRFGIPKEPVEFMVLEKQIAKGGV